ncbi:MAG TPA: 50S ribosomal protein L25 [Bryobacteraceae bacterium]|nr:50S ribosomal protein L25 [Bryobacteraceae bacterium]
MRKDITLTAEERGTRGKNEARRLRARGLAPAVVYGPGSDPVALAVSPKEINGILRSSSGHNTIFDIDMAGQRSPVMIIDWQHDPIKGRLLHVDLKRIDPEKRLSVKVPVHTHGEPKGVKIQGGLHEIVTREIEIECLPDDIPESFNLDVLELMLNQAVRASEVPLSGSMRLVTAPDTVISHVVAIRTSAGDAEEGAAATPEPEVIKKGKKEEAATEKKDDKKKK